MKQRADGENSARNCVHSDAAVAGALDGQPVHVGVYPGQRGRPEGEGEDWGQGSCGNNGS